ncbi:flagellar filament capping protein FliD [Vibrio alfacsensis]|uniref:flagellar filament capping protein FliD n=1 Tax=Vibrio alfacsensis TaxID=1074311 RepID=UPI0040682FA7
MSSVDPITMATQLATYDVLPFQNRYNLQTQKYQTQIKALAEVETALKNFRTAITDINKISNSVVSNSATSSQDGFFSASADASALSGSYQIFVEQIATAHQASANFPEGTTITADTEIPTTGTMEFAINGEKMVLDLSKVDTDGDGKATMTDLVKAINNDENNPGVNATLVRSNGETHLMFSSVETGVANKVSISVSGTALEDKWFTDGFTTLKDISEPKDAIIWIGGKDTGLQVKNSNNTFEGVIDGVDITVTKAQEVGEAPITLSVGPDKEATKEQIDKFISAYNSLMSNIDLHMGVGGEDSQRGALAGDASLRSIKTQLSNLIRADFGDSNLRNVGISIDRDGKLTIDEEAFEQAQENGGLALESLFNGEGHLLDSLEDSLEPYLAFGTGMFNTRKETLEGNIDRIDGKLTQLERKYEMSYNRYLAQFTQMNAVITQMNSNMSLFG